MSQVSTEHNPYFYKADGEGIFPYPKKYTIYFKDQKLTDIHNMMESDLKNWVLLLNKAYQNGILGK